MFSNNLILWIIIVLKYFITILLVKFFQHRRAYLLMPSAVKQLFPYKIHILASQGKVNKF